MNAAFVLDSLLEASTRAAIVAPLIGIARTAPVQSGLDGPQVATATSSMTTANSSRKSAVNLPATFGLAALPTRSLEASWVWRQGIALA